MDEIFQKSVEETHDFFFKTEEKWTEKLEYTMCTIRHILFANSLQNTISN